MSDFYDDLLEVVNDRLGTDFDCDEGDDLFKSKNLSSRTLGFSAENGRCSVEHSRNTKMRVNEAGTAYDSHDNDRVEFKNDYNHKGEHSADHENNCTISGKMIDGECSAVVCDEDWTVTLGGGIKWKFGEMWKFKANTSVVSPKLGDACKMFLNLEAERECTPASGDSKECTNSDQIEAKLNLQVQDDTNLGVSLKHNLTDLDQIRVQGVYSGFDKADGFFRMDYMQHYLGFGCLKANGNTQRAFEVGFGWDKHAKAGIYESPVWLRAGTRYKLGSSSVLSSNTLLAGHLQNNMTFNTKIDDHWDIEFRHHIDTRHTAKGSIRPTTEFGWGLNYSL